MEGIAVLGAGAIGAWTGLSLALGASNSRLTPDQSRVLLLGQSRKPWFRQGRAQLVTQVSPLLEFNCLPRCPDLDQPVLVWDTDDLFRWKIDPRVLRASIPC